MGGGRGGGRGGSSLPKKNQAPHLPSSLFFFNFFFYTNPNKITD